MNNKGVFPVVGALVVVLLLAIAGGVGYMLYKQGASESTTQSALSQPTQVTNIAACPDSTAVLTFNARNALSKSSGVSATYTIKANEGSPQTVTGNSTTQGIGKTVDVLASASNFIDIIIEDIVVQCGGQTVDVDMFATDTMAISIKNAEGTAILTDTAIGGVNNATAIASGGSANYEIKLSGKDKQSSGDLLIVLEHTNTTAVDSLTLSGLGGAAKADVPDFYATTAAGSKAFAFTAPFIEGAKDVYGTIGVNLKSGHTYPGQAIYVTVYSNQAFQDIDGTFKIGVEDADGTTKYEDTYDRDFFVSL